MRLQRTLSRIVLALSCIACASGRPAEPTTSRESSGDPLLTATYALEAEVLLGEMTRHPRGFLYRTTVEGTGREAGAGRTVQVSYVVRLPDGREMDRAEADAPLRFRIGDGTMIPALDAAVREMREGETRQLVIPPRLGYGARGRGPVPPNSILVMLVTLLRVS